MKYLLLGDRKIRLPAYPHHKNYLARYYRFFDARTLLGFLTIDGWDQVFKKIRMNRRTRSAVPRLLLIDPTTACNLKCTGCWACDYEKNVSLSYEKLDELVGEAEKLGILQIIFTGGEPLMRKEDILRLAASHRRITFGMFTNGTLIDENYAREMARVGNLNAFLSVEGFRDETDMRRGEGVYDKVLQAMDLLKKHDIAFGFSACYHAKNFDTVTSDAFLDFMRQKGAWLGWLFNYMPIGSDADLSLCCSPQQRAFVKEKIEAYHKRTGFLTIDFANTGHKSFGCVAAGTDYAHINANGDLEPCAFFHYSDANIHDMSLEEALRSPFFREFRNQKPFSENFLKPCPLMDVPEAVARLSQFPGVHSTHLAHPESGAELAAKTQPLADAWNPVAQELWENAPAAEKRRFGQLTRILAWGHKVMNQSADHENRQ
ncbi:MAG: radical SAM protein [Bacteroidales bacterium]